MRKLLTVLVAATTLSLGACSASGSDGASDGGSVSSTTSVRSTTTEQTTTTEPEEQALPVTRWATDFCGNYAAWLAEIRKAGATVGTGVSAADLPGAKAAVVTFFRTSSKATQTLVTSLQEGGSPDIDDGDRLVTDLVEKFEDFDDAITAVSARAEKLPVDDPKAFDAEVTALVASFDQEATDVGASFGELDARYPSPELRSALASACDL